MNFLQHPNIPDSQVSMVILDERADNDIKGNLKRLGIELILNVRHPALYEPVCCHPDMAFCHTGGRDIVYAPGACKKVVSSLTVRGFNMIQGITRLEPEYPADIAYNAAVCGRFAFHDFRYTDPVLNDILEQKGLVLVNVRQGYAKCSVCFTGQNSMITADRGIAEHAAGVGMDVLCIPPQKTIRLQGLDYGFIGGAAGMLGENRLAFTGSIDSLSACIEIKSFLGKKNITAVCLSTGCMRDYGSVLPIGCC